MSNCPFCSAPVKPASPSDAPAGLTVCTACQNPLVYHYDSGAWTFACPGGCHDIRFAAGEGSIGAELLKVLGQAVESLPILPEIAQRVMVLLRDPEVHMQDLVELINQDQVIALRILKMANSPVYGGLTEIKDLRSACTRLGLRTVANAVQAIANGRLYRTDNPDNQYLMESLWCHSLASAYCASEISAMLAEPCADIYFVAGLVHDVGKVLLIDVVSNNSSPQMRTLREAPELFQEFLSNFHSLVGLHIIRHWNLPPEFAISTFCHDHLKAVPDDSWLTLVHTVVLSSAIATACGYGYRNPDASLLGLPSTKVLGLNDIKLAALRINLEDRLEPLLDALSEGRSE